LEIGQSSPCRFRHFVPLGLPGANNRTKTLFSSSSSATFVNMFLCRENKKPIHRKLVVLGDGACGKTSLLNVYTRGYFPQVTNGTVLESSFVFATVVLLTATSYPHHPIFSLLSQLYEPTVFENYVQQLTIDGQEVQLSLWDTAGNKSMSAQASQPLPQL
jgi:GTPase SAR1 family protein